MKFANRDQPAWEEGERAYVAGDSIDMAIKKAIKAGFRPESNGYAAFITAFSRQVRSCNLRAQPECKNPVVHSSDEGPTQASAEAALRI